MEAKTHFARFMRRGMELARQLHSKKFNVMNLIEPGKD